jgi:hypothetical protein
MPSLRARRFQHVLQMLNRQGAIDAKGGGSGRRFLETLLASSLGDLGGLAVNPTSTVPRARELN